MTATSPAAGKHILIFVFITVLIDTIGFGIVLPVMPELIIQLTGDTVSEASRAGGWLMFAYAVMLFLFGPVIGNLSDHFGRRGVLLLSLFAFGTDYAVMGLAPTLAWLFVGRAIAGAAGAAYTTAYACVADISPPEVRAQNFGIIGSAFGVGFVIGPGLGGLLGGLGPRAPFFAAAALALVNFVYGYFLFPETLAPEMRRPFAWRRANTLGTLLQLRRYPAVVAVAGALGLWQLAHHVLPNTFAYYTKLKFHWSPLEIGASLAYAGAVMAVVQGGLTRVIIPRVGEYRAAIIGISVGALTYLGYAFAAYGWMMYVVMTFGAFMGLAYPSMNAIMSKQIRPNAQGELQGGVASLLSLTTIVGPVLSTQLFGYFTSSNAPLYFPGAAYFFSFLLACCCAAVFLWSTRGQAPAPVELFVEPEGTASAEAAAE